MKTSFFLTAAMAICSIAAFATQSLAADAAVGSADKSFIKNAYEDGLAEVKLGEMGQAKTGNADVKAFATQMVTDHGKANAELKTLADNKKVEVATEPTMVAKAHAKLLDAKTGADFDRAFAEAMVKDHKNAVEAFEKASKDATDTDVKNFAAKTLPTLKMHLSMAEELNKKVGGK
jgi:putative membrane protein